MKKIIFFVIWVVLLILVPVTVLKITPLAVAFKYPVTISGFFLRSVGLVAFILLFIEVILGAFMDKFAEKLGGWIFNFHIIQGKIIYALVFLHPILYVLQKYFIGQGLDPYTGFINICLLCKYKSELYISLGRISFWLLTVTVLTAIFRKSTNWLRENWRKMHILNYATFLLIGAHGFFVGRDFRTQPFYSFAITAYAIVAGIIIFVELPKLFKNFREWMRG